MSLLATHTEHQPAGSLPVPTVVEAERIAAVADPVIRNLQITQAYNEIGRALATRLGNNASWCALAVWASKQAGQTIRQQDPERLLATYLDPQLAAVVERLVRMLERTSWGWEPAEVRSILYRTLGVHGILARASSAIAEGNRKVFAEIGVGMARFIATLAADAAYDEEHLRSFCAALLPGPPPRGQELLQRAITSYYRALFEPGRKRRAELVLLANLDIGVHEQTSLQTVIQNALDAPVPDFLQARRQALAALHPRLGPLRPMLNAYLSWTQPLDALWSQALELARKVSHHVLTAGVLRLYLPTGELLWLGRDLRLQFPPDLRTLADPVLRQAVAAIDPTPDSSRDTGTDDWADYHQRMHFIADYFRAYQQEPRIFTPPFSPRDVDEIKAGRRPAGWL